MTTPPAEALEGASLCSLCPKLCRFACPVAAATADEAATPTAMSQAWLHAREGSLPWEAAAEALGRCTGCGACQAPCEYERDVPSTLYEARAEAWEHDAIPEGARSLHSKFLDSGNPFGLDLRDALSSRGESADFQRKGRVLYWPGCRALAEQADRVVATMDVLRLLGADHVSLPARDDVPQCCGAPLRVIGDRSGFGVAAAGLQQYFNRQRTWVTDSSSCLRAVETGYPEAGHELRAETLHIAEYLLFFREALAERGREAMERAELPLPTIRVHDACGLHRRLGRADAVYEVLELVTGQRPEPLGLSPDRTECCGAGDFHDLRRPEAAQLVGARSVAGRKLARGTRVVTGDSACVGALRQSLPDSVPVHDVAGFLVEWLAPLLED